jgi:hypothetical protein
MAGVRKRRPLRPPRGQVRSTLVGHLRGPEFNMFWNSDLRPKGLDETAGKRIIASVIELHLLWSVGPFAPCETRRASPSHQREYLTALQRYPQIADVHPQDARTKIRDEAHRGRKCVP